MPSPCASPSPKAPSSGPASRRGLYALTPDVACTETMLAAVRALIAGGCRWVQYRNKAADKALRRVQAEALAGTCRDHGVMLIVNDDVELALAVGAAGVHIGAEDGAVADVRARLGRRRLLGVSCYADLGRARASLAAGADYIAFGAVFPSLSKPAAARVPLELLTAARHEFACPIAAIGGITLANAPAVIAAGADLLAVISDIFGNNGVADMADVTRRARDYQSLFA